MSERKAAEWSVGTAMQRITPQEPTWMAGFAKRDTPADGVELDLQARAVALEDEAGRTSVIVSAEVLFVTRRIRDRVVERVAADTDVDPDGILLSATHTHCGPEFREFKFDAYEVPEPYRERGAAYRERLEEALVAVATDALASREPATLSFGHARCGFGMHRRLPVEDGIAHRPNPDGPVDHDVPVLVAERDDEPVAIGYGYACHTTTRFVNRYSGDWAGYANRFIEEQYPEATALFLIGAAGDQNPHPRREEGLPEHHGRTMASTVRAAVEAHRVPVRGPLRTVLEEQEIEFEDPPDRDGIEELQNADQAYLRARGKHLLRRLEEDGEISTTQPYPIQAFGFGDDLTLVALAGEPLVEYGITLKEALPGRVWVAGYANDDFTYVPTAQAVYEGGYEGDHVFDRTTYAGTIQPDVEERVLRRARTLAAQVRGSRSV